MKGMCDEPFDTVMCQDKEVEYFQEWQMGFVLLKDFLLLYDEPLNTMMCQDKEV